MPPETLPVSRVWNRVIDVGNLYDFMSRNVEHAARRDVVNIITHERFKFNWNNPTGHYRLEISRKVTPRHRESRMVSVTMSTLPSATRGVRVSFDLFVLATSMSSCVWDEVKLRAGWTATKVRFDCVSGAE